MPYTLKQDRRKQDPYIDKLLLTYIDLKDYINHLVCRREAAICFSLGRTIQTNGDLNYTISRILWSLFFRERRYHNAENLIGVILSVQHKLRREDFTKSLWCSVIYGIIVSCPVDILANAEQTLECIKLEMYTRHIRDYEDEKINTPENGDVNHEWPKRSKRSKKQKRVNVRKASARRKRLGSS